MIHANHSIPELPPDLIDRPALRQRLEAAWQHRCTLIVAPAGYGKTSLAAQWARATVGGDVVWWSPPPTPGAPLALLQHLVAATLARIPTALPRTRAIDQRAGRQDASAWLATLVEELALLAPRRVCYVIDDAHHCDTAAWTLLGDFVLTAPTNVQIALISRWQPGFDLSRLAARGRLLSLDVADLRYTVSEVAQVLATTRLPAAGDPGASWAPAPADELPAAHIHELTGGWPAGVRLVKELPNARAVAPMLDQDTLMAFLGQEVLETVPAAARAATIQSAYLPRFNQALLRELFGPEAEAIWQRNLFLRPLGDGWYRYDPLWRDFLLEHDRTPAARRAAIQARAAGLLADQGAVEAAIELYLTLEDWEAARQLLIAHGFRLIHEPDQMRRWFDRLPAGDETPELLHLRGLALRQHDPALAAETLGAAARAYGQARRAEEALQAVGEQCLIHFGQGDEEALIAAARGGFSVPNLIWHPQRRILLRFPLLLHQIKRSKYQQALRSAEAIWNSPLPLFWRWIGACVVGGLYGMLSRSDEGVAWLEAILRDPTIAADDAMRMSLVDLLANCLMTRGAPADLARARRLVEEAQALSMRYGVRLTRLQARATAIGIALISGDEAAIRAQAAGLLVPTDEPLPDIMRYRLQAVRAFAWARVGELARARADAEQSERGLLRDDAKHGADPRTWLMLAQAWYECRDNARTLATIETIIPLCQAWEATMLATKAEAIRAAVYLRMGDEAAAQAAAATIWPRLLQHHLDHMASTAPELLTDMVHAGLLTDVAPARIGQILHDQYPERLTPLLERLLAHADPAIRRRAVQLMGQVAPRAAYATLRDLGKDPDPGVRGLVPAALRAVATRPPYPLRVQLFGPLELWRDGQQITSRDWPRDKARHLFALLLLNRDRWLPREQIMDLLWPDSEATPAGGSAADGALRVALNALLGVLEPERIAAMPSAFVLSEPAGLRLNPAARIDTDVQEFEAAIAEAAAHEKSGAMPAALAAYGRAVDLYRDALLADAPYDQWALAERDRRLNEFVAAASRRIDLLLAYGAASQAIELAERLLRHDPYHEPAYAALKAAYQSLGQPGAARRIEDRERALLRDT